MKLMYLVSPRVGHDIQMVYYLTAQIQVLSILDDMLIWS